MCCRVVMLSSSKEEEWWVITNSNWATSFHIVLKKNKVSGSGSSRHHHEKKRRYPIHPITTLPSSSIEQWDTPSVTIWWIASTPAALRNEHCSLYTWHWAFKEWLRAQAPRPGRRLGASSRDGQSKPMTRVDKGAGPSPRPAGQPTLHPRLVNRPRTRSTPCSVHRQ